MPGGPGRAQPRKNCSVGSQNAHDGRDLPNPLISLRRDPALSSLDGEAKVQRGRSTCLESHSSDARSPNLLSHPFSSPSGRPSIRVLGKLAEDTCASLCLFWTHSEGLNGLRGSPGSASSVCSWRTGDTSQRDKFSGSFHPTPTLQLLGTKVAHCTLRGSQQNRHTSQRRPGTGPEA